MAEYSKIAHSCWIGIVARPDRISAPLAAFFHSVRLRVNSIVQGLIICSSGLLLEDHISSNHSISGVLTCHWRNRGFAPRNCVKVRLFLRSTKSVISAAPGPKTDHLFICGQVVSAIESAGAQKQEPEAIPSQSAFSFDNLRTVF